MALTRRCQVTIEGDDGDAVTAARRQLLSVAQQVRSGGQYLLGAAGAKAARSRNGRSPSPRQRQRRPVGRLQVFVDHSNIYFGAWNSRNPSEQDRTVCPAAVEPLHVWSVSKP